MLKNRSLAILVVFTLVAALIGGSTLAVLTSSASTVANNFSAGTLVVVAGEQNIEVGNYANMAPGDTIPGTFSVTNNGTLPLRYTVEAVTSGDLFAGSTPAVVSHSVYSDGDYILSPGDVETIAFDVHLPLIAENGYQAALGQLYFIVSAEQYTGEPPPVGTGTVSGFVVDATSGQGIHGAMINFRSGTSTDGPIIGTASTGPDGAYSLQLAEGSYTGEILAAGYVTGYLTAVSVANTETGNQNGVLTAAIGDEQYRIVLTWGANPSDLDSHLTGPAVEGGRFHVFYANRTYTYNGVTYAALDYDDTSSYGPETTTIYLYVSEGDVYRYSVHDYSNRYATNSTAMANSGASVQVYRGDSLVGTYNVPQQDGTLWTVFEIQGSTINAINGMTYQSNPYYVQ
ncbi:MAG: TasA family protein [Bacillota bacterium]|nr:TasA family protein [Bacillota bacterium]MDW7684204.1 TasA family protein [Bacillota bacterium]